MFSKTLINNAEWLLTVNLLGSHKAFFRTINVTRKATRYERHHFVRILECMQDLGISISPDSNEFNEVAVLFCESLFGNGDARWQAFFTVQPHVLAGQFIEFNKSL
ncbi:hypothetical protein L2755_01890 [Shewanella abyssi]|uniref:hypothetical protein n=1 Tax=Shewanella abyssi TaxID=311789 RepID=UPI00200FA462|nr:hypothetical protein [Shewanella abyssi]MCL1048383.1 hypothetical protein [Shewanella abyssi]